MCHKRLIRELVLHLLVTCTSRSHCCLFSLVFANLLSASHAPDSLNQLYLLAGSGVACELVHHRQHLGCERWKQSSDAVERECRRVVAAGAALGFYCRCFISCLLSCDMTGLNKVLVRDGTLLAHTDSLINALRSCCSACAWVQLHDLSKCKFLSCVIDRHLHQHREERGRGESKR